MAVDVETMNEVRSRRMREQLDVKTMNHGSGEAQSTIGGGYIAFSSSTNFSIAMCKR